MWDALKDPGQNHDLGLKIGAVTIADGFPGQRLIVLPRPKVAHALNAPGTSHLVVTACGYFPHARMHGKVREQPISEAVIMLCTRGTGWCRLNGTTHTVTSGQVVILPAGFPHAYGADLDDPWTLWWVHVAGRGISQFMDTVDMTVSSPVRVLTNVYGPVALAEETIRWSARDTTTASLLAASGAAWHLLTLLASMPKTSDSQSHTIEQARDYIRQNLDRPITVAQLASLARLSPSHFATLFRSQTGSAVLQYQTQLRMARARELLDTTRLTVARIGELSGYQDAYYFSRQFKAIHGVSPIVYRRQRRE
jgi:AraC family transcriptional regulator of arabinose operon